MKRIYSLTVLCFLFTVSFTQAQVNCDKTSELEYFYKYDVADLTLNRLFANNSPDKRLITIPQFHLDSIWHGLSAIYNVSSTPQRDSIFDVYCIHNISRYTQKLLPHIFIELDTSLSWTSNWLNGEIVTGYAELDELISTYEYQVYSTNPNYLSVVLFSDLIINTYALSDSLKTFNGIASADPYHVNIDGNKIQYYAEGDYQYFNFTLAWKDCFSGCLKNHKWKFKVTYSNCTVEYLGLESNAFNDLPNPINCNITSIIPNETIPDQIIIFPNPSKDKISIKREGIQKIELLNGLGQFILSLQPDSHLTTLDIEALKPGLYYLKIDLNGKTVNKRFIKE
ncbi:MAG: T9SS type A sorting domain-containing protein [Bacteroidales bacterium]|jgi:hypothetical protein